MALRLPHIQKKIPCTDLLSSAGHFTLQQRPLYAGHDTIDRRKGFMPKPGGLLTILAVGYILEAALDTKRFIPVNWQGSATWLWGKLIVNVTLQP